MNPCVIIPAYNAAKTIGKVVAGCRRYVNAVLVVDDGSSDQTTFLAEEAGAIALKHSRNKGKGAALKTAFAYALGTQWDVFVVMDSDGQHDPDDIAAFLEAHMEDHAAMLVGTRMKNAAGMPFVRRMTNRVMSAVISYLIKQKVPDTQCGYKLIPRRVLAGMNLESSNYDIETELLFRASCADVVIKSVPVKTIYADETSSIRPLPDTVRFVRMVLSFWKMRKKGISRKDLVRKQASIDRNRQETSAPAAAAQQLAAMTPPPPPPQQAQPQPVSESAVPSQPPAAQPPQPAVPETRAVRKKNPPAPKPRGEDELPMDY